jgi:hypothetical protein
MLEAVWWRWLVASAAGSAAWVLFPPTDNPMERTLFALICGFGAVYLVGLLCSGLYRLGRALLRR